jgi:hypothetical protein
MPIKTEEPTASTAALSSDPILEVLKKILEAHADFSAYPTPATRDEIRFDVFPLKCFRIATT